MDAPGWTDQPSRSRVVIEGRLASDGTRSTLVFEPVDGGWLVHLWGLSKDAVRITTEQARQIAAGLSGTTDEKGPGPRVQRGPGQTTPSNPQADKE